MLIELAMLTFATTSTGAVVPPPNAVIPIERSSVAFTPAADTASQGSFLLAKSSGSRSRGTRSSNSSSNRGAGGYQQTGQGGYQQTGQGGYQGSGQGGKPMDIDPPNTPPAVRTTPPSTPIWTPPASPPGN